MVDFDLNKAKLYASNILKRPEYRSIRDIVEPDEIMNSAYIYCFEKGMPLTIENITQYIYKGINSEKYSFVKSSPILYEKHLRKWREYARKYRVLLSDSYLRAYLKSRGKDNCIESIKELRRTRTLRREGKSKYEIITFKHLDLPKGAALVADIPSFADFIGYCVSAEGVFSCKDSGFLMLSYWRPKKVNVKEKWISLCLGYNKLRKISVKVLLKRAIKAGLIEST